MLACKHLPHYLIYRSIFKDGALCSVRSFWSGRLNSLDRFSELSKAFANDAPNLQRRAYLKRKNELKEVALGLVDCISEASNESLVKTLQACLQVSNFCKVGRLNNKLILELLGRLHPSNREGSALQIRKGSNRKLTDDLRDEASPLHRREDGPIILLISNAIFKLDLDISDNLPLLLDVINDVLPRLSGNDLLECYCSLGYVCKRVQVKCDVSRMDAQMQKMFTQLCKSKRTVACPRDIIRVIRATNSRENLGLLHATILRVVVAISQVEPTTREIYKIFKEQCHLLYTVVISGCLTTKVADAILENVWRFCMAYYMTTSKFYKAQLTPQDSQTYEILDPSVNELLYGKYRTKFFAAPKEKACMHPTKPLHISRNVNVLIASLQRMQLAGKTSVCRGLKHTYLYLCILHAHLIPTLNRQSREVLNAIEHFNLQDPCQNSTLQGEIIAQLESMGTRPQRVSLQTGLFEPLILYPHTLEALNVS